jgi:hypothetical protein
VEVDATIEGLARLKTRLTKICGLHEAPRAAAVI